jgi:long-chain acyl-CoA synthetase
VAGAMALQKAVCERFKKTTGVTIVEGFGLTETSPVLCCNPIDGTDRVGTIGLPLPSTDIKIMLDDETPAKIDEAGELWARGPQVMPGYWQRPDETAKVKVGEWFKTGDIASQSPDGFFKIVDRKKDMILVSGFNVYPNEVEEVVAHCPGVLEVAAVGIPYEKSGEAVKIFVVKKDPQLTEGQIIQFCKANLAAYKCPKAIEFRTELPKTNVGKILRRALRQ